MRVKLRKRKERIKMGMEEIKNKERRNEREETKKHGINKTK